MKVQTLSVIILVSFSLLICVCDSSERVVKLTDKRDGKKLAIKCNEYFEISGNPPTIRILPLDPSVTGAILSNYDGFVEKALSEGGANASFFLISLTESMRRGNLQRVAQKILYYECFGEALP